MNLPRVDELPTPEEDAGSGLNEVGFQSSDNFLLMDNVNAGLLNSVNVLGLDSYGMPPTDPSMQSSVHDPIFRMSAPGLSGSMGLGTGGLDWLDFLHEPIMDSESVTGENMVEALSGPAIGDRGYRNAQGIQAMQDFQASAAESLGSSDPSRRANAPAWSAAQQWPFEQSRERVPPRYQLPPLRDVLQGSLKDKSDGNGNTMECLIQLLSSPYIPKLDDSLQDYTILPAVHLLQRTVDKFFSDFHSVLPIIHVPTWSLSSCPTVLLTSMACIGAMMLEDVDSMDKSRAFSELCSRMILWLVSCIPFSASDMIGSFVLRSLLWKPS